MVKTNWILGILAALILSGCSRPISQILCDYYYNDSGGVRSHYKYKRYEDLTTPLPTGLEEFSLFETMFSKSKKDMSDKKRVTRSFLRFFSNGRCAWQNFSIKDTLKREDFDIDHWNMGYYEESSNGYRVYLYGTVNCGQFGKGNLVNWSRDTLIFESKTHFSYSLKVSDIPKEWLIEEQPDW